MGPLRRTHLRACPHDRPIVECPRPPMPYSGPHRCVSGATVPEGRGRRSHPGVTQSEPGGEEATGARERDRGGRRRGGPGSGPEGEASRGPDRLGRVRNGEAGPAAGGVRATGGDNTGAGPAGRPGKAKSGREETCREEGYNEEVGQGCS